MPIPQPLPNVQNSNHKDNFPKDFTKFKPSLLEITKDQEITTILYVNLEGEYTEFHGN